MPDSLTPERAQEINERLASKGLTKEQVEEIFKVLTNYQKDDQFGKALSLLLSNRENTSVIDLVNLLSNSSSNSDLGKVLTVLKTVGFDVKLSELFAFIQNNPSNHSGLMAFIAKIEEIPVLGQIFMVIKYPIDYLIVKPIQFVFSLLAGSETAKPTPTNEVPSISPKEDARTIYVDKLVLPAPQDGTRVKVMLNDLYKVDSTKFTHVICSDFVRGDTGYIRFGMKRSEYVPENNTRQITLEQYKEAFYTDAVAKQNDVLMVQPVNVKTGIMGPAKLISVNFTANGQ